MAACGHDECERQPILLHLRNVNQERRVGRQVRASNSLAHFVWPGPVAHPTAPAGQLKLLPTGAGKHNGDRVLTVSGLGTAHRAWVTSLPPLLLADGTAYDTDRIIPYAYRHTYAQRHADAGVPIDVLAGLMDHRNLNVTRGYYRVGEDRRRDAIDKVTA